MRVYVHAQCAMPFILVHWLSGVPPRYSPEVLSAQDEVTRSACKTRTTQNDFKMTGGGNWGASLAASGRSRGTYWSRTEEGELQRD